MEYVLAITFNTPGGTTSTLSITGVKPDITKEQVVSLMDTIISKNIFEVNAGELISKSGAKLTERKITKYDIAA